MSKPIAVVYSDIHFNRWQSFWKQDGRTRLEWSLRAHDEIYQAAKAKKVPILFCGDMFHEPKKLGNDVISDVLPYFTEVYDRRNVVIEYGISGNHDQSRHNYIDKPSPSYIRTLSKMLTGYDCIDLQYRDLEGGARIFGIPYLSYNMGMREAIQKALKDKTDKGLNILMLHCDLPDAVSSTGYKFDDVHNFEGVKELLPEFDLVLNGHIHKPQKLWDNVHIIGSPIHQDFGNRGVDMGYYTLMSDGELLFHHLDQYPQFKEYPKGTEPPDNFDYWVESGEKTESQQIQDVDNLNMKSTKNVKRVIKKYCKSAGITSKEKKQVLTKVLLDHANNQSN